MLNRVLNEAYEIGKAKTEYGNVATYIPELGKADKNDLGICISTQYGMHLSVGQCEKRFTIQSISKIISFAVALEKLGADKVFKRVGMEPSGDAFNSLMKLEKADSTPHNPMVNAGAMVICGYLCEICTIEEMVKFARRWCLDDEIYIDEDVFASEMAYLSRNRAIAYLLHSKGYITADVEKTLEFYVKMCSLSVTAKSLANLGLILACNGVDPKTNEVILQPHTVKTVNTIMFTCGMYDGAGEFALKVGLPSKSGVGGGIISVVKGTMGIGIYGPALDEKGNSIAGIEMLRYVSEKLNLHMFG